jgi:predicted TIM-barrel enzyme
LQKIVLLRSDNSASSIVNIGASVTSTHLRFNTCGQIAVLSQVPTIAAELDTTSD